MCGKQIYSLDGHNDCVNAVALSPDGLLAVTASLDKTLKIWDIINGKYLYTIEGHTDLIYTVVISPDGRQIISYSRDHSVIVWDLTTGKMLCRFIGESPITAIAVTGNTLLAGEESGRIHFLEWWKPE